MKAEWFSTLCRDAADDQHEILLYSLQTEIGELAIWTRLSTFKPNRLRSSGDFWLTLDGTSSGKAFNNVFDAVIAAHKHRTGIDKWDGYGQEVSDYLGDWTTRVSKYFIFNYINLWIEWNKNSSLREMVDDFDHDQTSLVDRHSISDFLEEMIVTGQLKRLPSDSMTPAELDGVLRLAKEYGVEVPHNRYS